MASNTSRKRKKKKGGLNGNGKNFKPNLAPTVFETSVTLEFNHTSLLFQLKECGDKEKTALSVA